MLPEPSQPWYALDSKKALALLASDENGLTEAEANQRLGLHGANLIPQAARVHPLRRFLQQFNNVLIYVLLGAAFVTGMMAHWNDMLVILAVVLINATIGFVQERKAEQAIDAIRHLLVLHANVLRAGSCRTIDAALLVPGDVVTLAAGDKVPADLRILRATDLAAQEAVLTGESFDVEKQTPPVDETTALTERRSMLYGGTLITRGTATGLVTATGTHTEMGKIGQMMQEVVIPQTPLIRKINRLARGLTIMILAVAAFMFLYGLLVRQLPLEEIFMMVVGIAVSAIPEGLPAVISITLAFGVAAMARQHAIVRHLPAIETIGSVNVICTDKTGTLTLNQLMVTDIVTAQHTFHVSGAGYTPEGTILFEQQKVTMDSYPALHAITRAAVLNNDAQLHCEKGVWELNGEPTEGALLSCAIKAGHDHDRLDARWPRTASIPFSAEARLMATLHHDTGDQCYLYVKGAPEAVLALCSNELLHSNLAQPLNKPYWENQMHRLAAQGKRVLAVAQARRPYATQEIDPAMIRDGLVLLGLFGITDMPRPEAASAIAACHAAGIRVKMITGDHPATATAIGKNLGIADDERAMTGADMDRLSDAALAQMVPDIHIYARMQPVHKLRLVKALQANGSVVAMTGDGVNDAPALKAADIGIAMGKGGTEVAKESAQMVLADDNFASIVQAVEQGRSVYRKLQRTIRFMLTTDGSEGMVLVLGLVSGLSMPITALQILWVNTVTAVTLSLALAFTGTERAAMRQRPVLLSAPLFSPGTVIQMIVAGLFMAVVVFLAFHGQAEQHSAAYSRSFAVNLLVAFQVVYLLMLYPMRQKTGTLRAIFPALLSIVAIVLLQLGFTYHPWSQALFGIEPLSVAGWVQIGQLCCLMLVGLLAVDLPSVIAAKSTDCGTVQAFSLSILRGILFEPVADRAQQEIRQDDKGGNNGGSREIGHASAHADSDAAP